LISIEIVYEAIERLAEGSEMQRIGELLTVSTLGLIVNVIGVTAFGHAHHGHSHAGHDHGHSHETHDHSDHSQKGHDHSELDHKFDRLHASPNASPYSSVPATPSKPLYPHSHTNSHAHHHHHHHSNENMYGIYLHILADTLGSVAVVVSTLAIHYFGWSGFDPLASCVIAILIFASAIPLVHSSATTLLLTIPEETEFDLREALAGVSKLRGVTGYAAPKFWLEGREERRVLGVIHVHATKLANLEDVKERTVAFLKGKNMDVTVQVERDRFDPISVSSEMATDASISDLLSTLDTSLSSAVATLPESTALKPQPDGISLLDTKNELLLAYLHNLSFLILFKLQNQSHSQREPPSTPQTEFTEKLIALRVYLEKGVRPLESRLKYQVDKLLLAASEADASAKPLSPKSSRNTTKRRTSSASASDDHGMIEPSDLSHRPNPAAMMAPKSAAQNPRDDHGKGKDEVYRPPRITPIAPPTTTARESKGRDKDRRQQKSHLLDTFVREELSSAPLAEMSIGAGSGLRGKEAEKERERRAYEETRLVRLPAEGKKGQKRARDVKEFEGMDVLAG
ncbi:MAG: hypothetical protein Q9214_006783, partial [Letrouitia sp. 1 TL-2023]